MGILTQIYAIVWKDVYVQAIKRHYLITLFEVVLICLSFFAVEQDRPLVALPTSCEERPCLRLSPPRDYPERNESQFNPPQLILYTPRGDKGENQELVKAAFSPNNRVKTRGFDSEKDMLDTFYRLTPEPKRGPEQRVVAVVFGKPPHHSDLEFTVRFFDDARFIERRRNTFAVFSTLPNPVSQRESVAYCQIALVRAKAEKLRQLAVANGKDVSTRRTYSVTTRRMSEGPAPEDAPSERWLMVVRLGIGYLVPFCTLVGRLSEEAYGGIREKLRLAGLKDSVYWLGHFLAALFKGSLSITIVMAYMTTVEYESGGLRTSFLENTDKMVALVSLVIFSVQYITTAMVLSLFFADTTAAIVFAMCYWITAYVAPWLTLEDFEGLSAYYIRLSRFTKLLTSVLPCVALHWCFRIIGCANLIGEKYSLSSVSEYVLQRDNVTMLEIWMVMLTYSVVACIAIWYLNNVLSWARGVPLQLWFPLSPAYWLPNRQGAFQQVPPVAPDGVHFERYPPNKQEVIFANRLEYEEEHTHVLRDTNFKAYANELLAVIGPSGAGKSSLVRIITGMHPPTGGQVIVEGYDVTTQTASACASMGVVLQKPVLFSDLTAYEHLLFFGGLAGLMGETLIHRAVEVKDMLLLSEVSAMMSTNMNSSCQRRLDLAIAIMLSPRVLILDEPTSGMDIASRYHVWGVLGQVKQKACVIMTTSDIDDIEAVADRMAILGYGGLKCFGTPTFLRQRYGCGYNLHVKKAPNFQTSQLVQALQGASRGTSVLQDHKHFAILNIGDRPEHVAVSNALHIVEQRQRQYGIEAYKVAVITTEDIFLRVIMEIDAGSVESKRRAAQAKGRRGQVGATNIGATSVQHSENVMAIATADVGGFTQLPREAYESSVQIQEHMQALYDLAAGKPRNGQIFLAMLTKRRMYLRQTLSTPLACWLLPSLLMFLVCRYQASNEERLAVHFGADRIVYDLATLHPQSDVLLARDGASAQLADSFYRPYARSAPLTVDEVDNMDTRMRKLKKDRTAHRSAVAGAEFVADSGGNSGRAIAWYHGDYYHTQSASANLLGTALLRWASDDLQASMVSMLQPMRRRNRSIYSRSLRQYRAAEELHSLIATQLMRFILLPAATSVTAASFVLFAIDDRASNSKAMQLMSGVPPLLYWIGNYVWDMLMSVISLFCMFFPVSLCDPMFFDVAPAVTCIFMAYVHSILAFVYWFSFFMDSLLPGFILVNVVASLSGTVCGLAYQLSLIGTEQELLVHDPPREPTLWLLYLLPPFSYTWALIKTSQKVAEEKYCTGSMADVRDVCAYVQNSLGEGSVLLPNLRYCCAHYYASNGTSVSKLPSFSMHRDGIAAELLVMVAEGCVLLLLLALFEKGVFRSWAPGKAADAPGVASPLDEKEMPPDVAAEARYVEKAIAAHDLAKPALLVLGLQKQLYSLNVLRGLSFHVEPGEAFAVAGLRGCGKTTLLNVLSGRTMPSSGTALIGDVPLQNLAGWEQRIGVCPTHDSVLGPLTVNQTLRMYANIRGIRPEDIDRLLDHLILLLNLTQSVNSTVEECGAVTRRKLAVAIAIIGLPPVVLMDDPATGLDLMSKRKIYRTISMLRYLVKSAVFIVTHSLSDCVVMSDRMAIMLDGQFQCVGTVAELRERLCEGTVLLVKLKLTSAYDVEALKLVHMLVLKAFPSATYNGRLGHSIEYMLTPSAPWSQLVHRVHELQVHVIAHAIDVVLTDMTLEHALLKIVRYQKSMMAPTPAADVIA